MKAITLLQPQKIVFGTGCIQTLVEDYKKMGLKRLFVLTAPPILPLIEAPLASLKAAGISIETYQDIVAEPTVNDFKKILEKARSFKADSVVGIGGGSVLDVTKLVAPSSIATNRWKTASAQDLSSRKDCGLPVCPPPPERAARCRPTPSCWTSATT